MDNPSPLSLPLEPLNLSPRPGLKQAAALGFRHVQISASQPGFRPRDLGESARRDLRATLRRLELICSGLDLWIPAEHFVDPARTDRAVEAVGGAIELASFLDQCPLSLALPLQTADDPGGGGLVGSLIDRAAHFGVEIADHNYPWSGHATIGRGIDLAVLLNLGCDPAAEVVAAAGRIASARLVDLTTSGLRAPLGCADGRLDVAAYRAALSAAGYHRPIVLDCRQWPDPIESIEQSTRTWQTTGVGIRTFTTETQRSQRESREQKSESRN